MDTTITTRQAHNEVLLATAALAGEVEALLYDAPEVVAERLRQRVRAAGITQVGTPGEDMPYAPAQHEVMGERPADGAPVTILRPGYLRADGALLARALVVAA